MELGGKEVKNKNLKKLFSNTHFKQGTYSVGLTVIVLAIIIVLNLLLNQLPSNLKSIDMSDNKIYSIGDVSKEVVEGLDKDVTIYVVAEPDTIDKKIEQFVNNYAAMSKHIKVEVLDPVLHPSVLTEYETTKNSLVVSCEETNKKTSIPFDDIILYNQQYLYYYNTYVEESFDGEGQLTSAIDYVTNEATNTIYTTEGHGEGDLSASVTDLIDKQNINLNSVNLLTEGKIPDDCDLLFLNAPTSDIADDEKTMITDFLNNGGNVLLMIGDTEKETPNLDTIMSEYGLEMVDGYIADMERYYQNSYFNIFPVLSSSSAITQDFTSKELALVSGARGMKQVDTSKESLTITPFLTTSENGYAITSSGQEQGEYVLGATVVDQIDDEKEAKLIVTTVPSLIDESITGAFSNLMNLDIFMNAVTWYFDDVTNISIAAKSLDITYNTVANAGTWGSLFIFIIPVATIGLGFIIWLRRRKA